MIKESALTKIPLRIILVITSTAVKPLILSTLMTRSFQVDRQVLLRSMTARSCAIAMRTVRGFHTITPIVPVSFTLVIAVHHTVLQAMMVPLQTTLMEAVIRAAPQIQVAKLLLLTVEVQLLQHLTRA